VRRAASRALPGRAAGHFLVNYDDRIFFGNDAHQPEEYTCYWRVFEINGGNVGHRAFWQLHGIDLPMIVLKKV
jgi:hypothetical protein